jgi:hypothetical protein
MRFRVPLLTTAALAAGLCAGCVDRRFVIESNVPGALVYQNGVPIGSTPVDSQFVYYGKYNFTLVKDGYETQQVHERIAAPWFAYPPFDFVVEVLWPFRIHDTRRLFYELTPVKQVRPEELLSQANELRQQGQNLPPPTNPKPEKESVPPASNLPVPTLLPPSPESR